MFETEFLSTGLCKRNSDLQDFYKCNILSKFSTQGCRNNDNNDLLLLLLLTAIELSLSGSSPYTSTDKTNKNKYT